MATREVYEGASAGVVDVDYQGHHTMWAGHVTVITCAEGESLDGTGGRCEASEVGMFDELPSGFSFGDGRERLFLDYAWVLRASRGRGD